jgi:hypothetical protein
MVEAPVPHGMVSSLTAIMYKVFGNIHMPWMGRWIHHHVITTSFVGPDFDGSNEILGCS